MNRSGAEKVMSVYWFAILLLVAVGVFIMVYNFYHHPYDVREIEANIIVNNVADCVSNGGVLQSSVLEPDFATNFLDFCNLNFETDDEDPQYYVSLEVSGLSVASEGNRNLISSCGVESEVEDEKLAKCAERSFYSLDSNGNLIEVNILSIVRKTEKNVRV